MKLRIFRFLKSTLAEGPGKRACIWVQGCKLRCENCAASQSWDLEGGYEVEVEELIKEVLQEKDLEGITFLGEEPFLQPKPLAYIAKRLRENNLSVITFTGYNYEDLLSRNDEDINELLNSTDLLIDGKYEKELADLSRPWVGLSNQRFIFLTGRYKSIENDLSQFKNRIEVKIQPDGQVVINGMTDFEALLDMIENI